MSGFSDLSPYSTVVCAETSEEWRAHARAATEQDENAHYDRTGLEVQTVDVLGVKVPRVIVPLNPGKNITVIAEVVAMNHLLKYAGVDSAALFDQRLRRHMEGLAEYLEEDYE